MSTHEKDDSTPKNPSRREMLKRTGAAGVVSAAVAVPAIELTTPAQAQTKGAPLREALETLTAAEADVLEAMCARLIPSDENGPGASEARAAHYIDRALTGPLASSKPAYVTGLAAVDAYAQATKGAPFVKLNAADQDAILTQLEANKAPGVPNAAGFFNMVRNHTIQGTFCDPYYGGNHNFVGWDLIGYPGLRMAVSPEEQSMSRPPKPVRKSAYDEAMFAKRNGGGHGH
jgi:gluconate 2-dehydrogenase gamma chain